MTLRVRLMWLMLSMVAIVAATLTALTVNSLAATSVESAIATSEGASRQVQSFLLRRFSAPAETDLSADEELTALLEQTMAQSRAIVEVNIAGAEGAIEASSNPSRIRTPLRKQADLRELHDSGPWDRIRSILTAENDYETRASLGIVGSKTPLYVVQILVSPVLLRATILPGLRDAAAASGVALALAIALAWWSARIALRPLARISYLIDDISSGRLPPEHAVHSAEARELAVIESKLNLLGERYRGAQESATSLRTNLEGALEKLDAETRRKIEGQIAVARRLTAINSLTGRAAHEIKNPLNAIALRVEVLRSRLADESPDSQADVDILAEEITRLDRVVRTFLDFNRPVELEPEDVNVGDLASDVLDFLKPEAERKGITISLERPSYPLVVRADVNLLRQALLNITVNAVEAMGQGQQGGQLAVNVANGSDTCSIRIADTGPGIPPAEKAKIFELYFTTKPRGSGIGLAITAKSIQLFGGSIDVESKPGEGTAFTVTLPLAGAAGSI
jgi:signal transduction histidine kinase